MRSLKLFLANLLTNRSQRTFRNAISDLVKANVGFMKESATLKGEIVTKEVIAKGLDEQIALNKDLAEAMTKLLA